MHGLLAFDNKNEPVSLPIVVSMCSVGEHILCHAMLFTFGKAHSKLQLESIFQVTIHNRLPRSGSICISLVTRICVL